MLAELEAAGLRTDALYLWRLLRRLDGWRDEQSAGREVRDDAPRTRYDDAASAIQPTLNAVDRLLREADPGEDTLEGLSLGLMHLAIWAEEHGALGTAVALLQGAESLNPENPHFAYNVGRVARKLAAYPDAEAWLKWAYFVAREGERWDVATLALSGLGNLHRQRGNLPRARKYHTVAWRMAKRHGLRTLEGDALYDLCVISLSSGDGSSAVDYARQALTAYGPGHGQVYRLANDFAWFWMDSYGKFESAAHVFISLLDYIWEPPFRVLLLANTTRAAAGAGWMDVFEGMWVETWALIRQQLSRQGHAAALTQLALGAGNLGHWERALLAAGEALKVARQRKEAEAVLTSEEILNVLNDGVLRDERILEIFKDRRYSPEMKADEESTDLTVQFANAMRARRDDAPESPTRALLRSSVS
ncbi:MAG: hypothetical protein JO040_01450 [Gemmatimonadetes bacterium]|nr:hypothetical protein [Gemmatimonadota bacterium]